MTTTAPPPRIAPARPASVNPRFTEPQPLDLSNSSNARWSFLIQGPSGSGKTHFICSMPTNIVVGYTETNLAVVQGFVAAGVKLELYPLRSWDEFEWFVRKTKNREWNAATVALDTYGLMGERLVLKKMTDPSNVKGDGNLKQSVWNHIKNDQWTQVLDFVGAATPLPGSNLPAYHIVMNVHEREEYETTGTGDDKHQMLVGVNPSLPGSFRDEVGGRFDCVFVAAERPRREKGPDGVMRTTGSDHILWTVPPDHLRHTKDGVGGKCGRHNLPPMVENTFAALCGAWGVDPATLEVVK